MPPAEIVVVDDGSDDDTGSVLEAFRGAIRSVRIQQSGKSVAVNTGLRYVTGDYVWIFDDDDVAVEDALARLVDPLERDEGCGFSYGSRWYTASAADGSLGRTEQVSRVPDVKDRGLLPALLESNFLAGAMIFARRSCYAAVGDYDPSLLRSQDYEMAIRIARRFRGARVEGGPLYYYRQHLDSRSGGRDGDQVRARNARQLEYDQVIFRRIHAELALGEYLGQGETAEGLERTATLQRAAVMASKHLLDEVVADLSTIADGPDQSALTPREITIVRGSLARRPWYGWTLWTDPTALSRVRSIARHSPTVAQIYGHLNGTVWQNFRSALRGVVRAGLRADRRRVRKHLRNARDLAGQLARMSRA